MYLTELEARFSWINLPSQTSVMFVWIDNLVTYVENAIGKLFDGEYVIK